MVSRSTREFVNASRAPSWSRDRHAPTGRHLKLNDVASADAAGPHNVSIDSHAWEISKLAQVKRIRLGNSAEYLRIERQGGARQSRYHAARTWDRHAQEHLGPDRQRVPDPRVFGIIRVIVGAIHDDIRPETLEREFSSRIRCLKSPQRRCGYQMNGRVVE